MQLNWIMKVGMAEYAVIRAVDFKKMNLAPLLLLTTCPYAKLAESQRTDFKIINFFKISDIKLFSLI